MQHLKKTLASLPEPLHFRLQGLILKSLQYLPGRTCCNKYKEVNMGEAQQLQPMTAAQYLESEPAQLEKYQYIHGDVFAMGGASRRHATVSGNLLTELDRSLEGSPCRVYIADMNLEIKKEEIYFYPDVLVTCDPGDHKAEQFMRSPVIVAEVLSDSTAAFDRGDKSTHYRRPPSLKEFVLIDPERKRIELYRRTKQDTWELLDILSLIHI